MNPSRRASPNYEQINPGDWVMAAVLLMNPTRLLLTIAVCYVLGNSVELAYAQNAPLYGLEEQVVFPDGLEEVATKYLDSLLKGDRQSLAKLLDETLAEQKCFLLTQALKDLREKRDLRVEKRIFDRPLTDMEYSQLTPASTLAACLCIGVSKDLSRKPGDIVGGGLMLKGHRVEERRIVGVIHHHDFALIVYQRIGGWISMIEDDLNVLSCRKTQNGWRLSPSINFYKLLGFSYQSPVSNHAEQREEPKSR